MNNAIAIPALRDDQPVPYELTAEGLAAIQPQQHLTGERLEARLMLDELKRILIRTGNYRPIVLHEAMKAQGTPVNYRTLSRWLTGASTPFSTTPVEHLARAAGVDRAFLMVEVPA